MKSEYKPTEEKLYIISEKDLIVLAKLNTQIRNSTLERSSLGSELEYLLAVDRHRPCAVLNKPDMIPLDPFDAILFAIFTALTAFVVFGWWEMRKTK
jgi:hypothetical protein